MGNGESARVGEYDIIKELGSGAFGQVHKARKDGVVYALKQIAIGRREIRERILQEIHSLVGLTHQNIVQQFSSFVLASPPSVWIVFEYCDGGTLNSIILYDMISQNTLVEYFVQIAKGVAYLHSKDVVHRDIKPDNILLQSTPTGHVLLKIADFGLARVWKDFSLESPYYSFTYTPKGPFYYTAPEVFKEKVTFKCDIFSLGCLVIAMFSRTTIYWVAGRKLLAPYIPGMNEEKLQVCEVSEEQKLKLIKDSVTLSYGDQRTLQTLVYEMVQGPWRLRPTAENVLERLDSLSIGVGCNIL